MSRDPLLSHAESAEMHQVRTADDDKFLCLLCKMRELHDDKGADYGDGHDQYSNFRRSRRFGVSPLIGCLVRLSDKFERVVQLSQHKAHVKDESLTDTLIDLANYALIAVILHDEEKQP